MHTSTLALLLGIACVVGAGAARAGADYVDLDCYNKVNTSPCAEQTLPTPEQTSVGSGTETDSVGFNFNYTQQAGDTEIWCQWTVPDNYDDTANWPPSVEIAGWSTTCVLCVPGLTCSATPVVEFEVSSRAYGNADRASASWGTADSLQFTWTSESCGSPCSTNCWQSDRVKIGSADATVNAYDWADGELVFIRILRDQGVSDDLPAKFHVSRARLKYPID